MMTICAYMIKQYHKTIRYNIMIAICAFLHMHMHMRVHSMHMRNVHTKMGNIAHKFSVCVLRDAGLNVP
jgi:hypothetical protein